MTRMRMQTEGWTRIASGHYQHHSGVEVRNVAKAGQWWNWEVRGGRNDGAVSRTACEAQYRGTDARASVH